MSDFPAPWLVAVAVAIGDGKAEPSDFEAARRVLEALKRECALRRLNGGGA
jgi:tellurite resistance protein